MPVASADRRPATFEIKSASLPLVALLLKSADIQALAQELAAQFGELPEFFDHDPLVIDLSPLQVSADQAPVQIVFDALLSALRPYRVAPIAARGGTEAQMQAAFNAGLAPAPDARIAAAPAASASVAAPAAPAAPAVAEPPPASALVIDRPVRSGQQIYARGRDLVCLAMVNPGAEVIADGHIHVYAPLRGRAIAGARGDAQARLFAMTMEPELVSIAGVYRTSDSGFAADLWGRAAQVRLAADDQGLEKLIITPLNLD